MTVKTVKELMKELAKYPPDMGIVGYNGADCDCLCVSVYKSSYAKDGLNQEEVLIIDVD